MQEQQHLPLISVLHKERLLGGHEPSESLVLILTHLFSGAFCGCMTVAPTRGELYRPCFPHEAVISRVNLNIW